MPMNGTHVATALLFAGLLASAGCIKPQGASDKGSPEPGSWILPLPKAGDEYRYEEKVEGFGTPLETKLTIEGAGPATSRCFDGERSVLTLQLQQNVGGLSVARTLLFDAHHRVLVATVSTVAGRGPYINCSPFDAKSYTRWHVGGFNDVYLAFLASGVPMREDERRVVPLFEDNFTFRRLARDNATAPITLEVVLPVYGDPGRPVGNRTVRLQVDDQAALPRQLSYGSGTLAGVVTLKAFKPGTQSLPWQAEPVPAPKAQVPASRALAYGDDPDLDGGSALLSFKGALRTARASPGYAAYSQLYPDNFVVYAAYEDSSSVGTGIPGSPTWCIHFTAVRTDASQRVENHGHRSCVQGQDSGSPPLVVVVSESAGQPSSRVEIPLEVAKKQGRVSLAPLIEAARKTNPANTDIRYHGGSSLVRWGTPIESILVIVAGTGAERKQTNYGAVTGQLWLELPV